jgi:shikimate dehydrogenase
MPIHIRATTKLYAVLGDPIHHSKSPLIHNYWLDNLNIDAVYVALRCDLEELSHNLPALSHLNVGGVNLTVPLKEKALAVCHHFTPQAQAIGAVNTVLFRNKDIIGHNTDGDGFLASLKQPDLSKVILLGAGGAARAVVHSLSMHGCINLTIINRNIHRAEQLLPLAPPHTSILDWQNLDQAFQDATLIIQATSLGLSNNRPYPALPWFLTHPNALAYDLLYGNTSFLASAEGYGRRTQDGLGMLVHQAAFAFEQWHGVMPPIDEGLWSLLA